VSAARLLLLIVPLLAGSGCEQRMDRQPKYETYESSSRFPQQQSALPVPEHTVPYQYRSGASDAEPEPLYTLARLNTGRERFNIYCAPCHGRDGYGDGPVVQHGFPSPPSFHSQRLRSAPERHFVDVIEHGYGIMYSYADRVSPGECWAIAAYIRALQVSRHLDTGLAPELIPAIGAHRNRERP
jgi:mono/diheme cytochrome c family protein